MRIAALQTDLHWENRAANFQHIQNHINDLENIDLIILPEMFNSGFTMNPASIAEDYNGATLSWMKKLAKEKQANIIGSIAIKRDESFYNSLFWVQPNGQYFFYDKRHLFRMANEHKHYKNGTDLLIVNKNGFNFCPLVCYDLRFPVWSRNIDSDFSFKYDVLIYIANWPEARISAWVSLLQARAIENQAYVVGVNRIGIDGNNVKYCGESRIFNPKGERLDSFEKNKESVQFVQLNKEFLKEFRKKFPANLDADSFEVI